MSEVKVTDVTHEASAASTPAFVVLAEFQVRPAMMSAFLAAAYDDARDSMANEPGCRQFDVTQPEDTDDVVLLYEVYDSRAAFDAHLQTPHLARFRASISPLIVEERPVRFATRHYP